MTKENNNIHGSIEPNCSINYQQK